MIHSFNLKLAEKYGIEQAILIEQIYWWIHKNDCILVDDMCHEGKIWCRSTAKGFAKYIPYMKPDKIWRTLRKMEGTILLVGNFNRQALNQTLWYTFTDEFIEELKKLDYDFENFKNAILKNEKSINTINSINIDNTIQGSKKRLSNDNQKKEEYSNEFEEFWKVYGFYRGKGEAYKRWKKLSVKDKKDALSVLPAYFADCKANNRQKRYPSVYISKRTWEDDFTSEEAEEAVEIPADDIPKWEQNKKWMQSKMPKWSKKIDYDMFATMRAMVCFNSRQYAAVLEDMYNSGFDGDIVAEFKRRVCYE